MKIYKVDYMSLINSNLAQGKYGLYAIEHLKKIDTYLPIGYTAKVEEMDLFLISKVGDGFSIQQVYGKRKDKFIDCLK